VDDLIATYGLIAHNVGRKPTFVTSRGRTIIDVTISTAALAGRIRKWKVSDKPTLSDHRLIEMELAVSPSEVPTGRNYKKADWAEYANCMGKMMDKWETPRAWNPLVVEDEVTRLYAIMGAALDKVCPIREFRGKRGNLWWTEECEERRRASKRAYRRALSSHTQEDWDNYKELRRDLQGEIKVAKRASWRRFTDVDNCKDAARLQNILYKKAGAQLGLLTRPDGTYTESVEESTNLLMSSLFEGSRPPDPNQAEEHARARARGAICQGEPLRGTEWINAERFWLAVKQFGPQKAAGADGIKPIALQHIPDAMAERLVLIYRACIQLGYTPRAWRVEKVVFLPKPGKPDYSHPKAFRPIALMSFLFKTLERLVIWHIEATALVEKPIHDSQHGFRRGRSTETVLMKMVDTIERALNKQQYALGVFLDIQGAFNSISQEALLRGMKAHNVDREVQNWYRHYLQHRICEVEAGGAKVIQIGRASCRERV
jgi:hypothetical protein